MSEVTSMDLVDPVNLSLSDLIKINKKDGKQQKGTEGQQPKKGKKKRDGVKQATPGGQQLQKKGGQKAEQAMKKGGRKRENAFNKGRGIEAMDVDVPPSTNTNSKKKKQMKLKGVTVNGQRRLSTGSNGGNKSGKGGQQNGQKGGQQKGGQQKGGQAVRVPSLSTFVVPEGVNIKITMRNDSAARSPIGGGSLSLSNSRGGSKKKPRAPREGPKANAGASMQGSGKSQRTVIVQQSTQTKRQAGFNANRNISTAAGGGGGGKQGGRQGGKQGGGVANRRVVIKKSGGGGGNGGGNRRR